VGRALCRADEQIVQPLRIPKERFLPRVFSAEIFLQYGVS
jgi:hypothetical protein